MSIQKYRHFIGEYVPGTYYLRLVGMYLSWLLESGYVTIFGYVIRNLLVGISMGKLNSLCRIGNIVISTSLAMLLLVPTLI